MMMAGARGRYRVAAHQKVFLSSAHSFLLMLLQGVQVTSQLGMAPSYMLQPFWKSSVNWSAASWLS